MPLIEDDCDFPLPSYHEPPLPGEERDRLTTDRRVPNDTAARTPATTFANRLADRVAQIVGSWRFTLVLLILLGAWLVVNSIGWIEGWDPYPFMLLNLVLAFQAAFTAPIILMSQNRREEVDRREAAHDYLVDQRAEQEVAEIRQALHDLARHQREGFADLQLQQIYSLHAIEELRTTVNGTTISSPPRHHIHRPHQ